MPQLEKLVMTNFQEGDLPSSAWERLRRCAQSVVLQARPADPNDGEDYSAADATVMEEYRATLKEADGLILRLGQSARANLLDAAPWLRYIGMYGTGTGAIDLDEAKRRGIVVTNVADYSTEAVAEFAVLLTGMVSRHMQEELFRIAEGDIQDWDSELVGRDIKALRVGIIGAGNIGQRTAKLFKLGYECEVSYWSRKRKPPLEELGVTYNDMNSILAESDVISIHLALNSGTTDIISAEKVDLIRDGAIVVNTAPNELIDLDRVLERCNSGAISYAMDHPDEITRKDLLQRLRKARNVLVVPPIGYTTQESTLRKESIIVENVESFLEGTPQNHVNP